MTNRIGVDLFSGAGGLSLGARMAGVDVRYAVEIDPFAAQTYKKNHPDAKVHCQDIRTFDVKDEIGNESPFIVMGGGAVPGLFIVQFQGPKHEQS